MKIQPGFDFDAKYDLYSSMIYKICATYLGNKQDTEDAVQDVFVKMAYHSPSFARDEEEKAWIIRVTINHCKNIVKSAWKKRVVTTDTLFLPSEDFQTDVSVFNAVVKLDLNQKEVIYLYYIEGYKINEISKILKISESCVKMRLSRAKDALKQILEEDDEQ